MKQLSWSLGENQSLLSNSSQKWVWGLMIQSIDSICFAICGFITNSAQPSQLILGFWRAGIGFLYQVYPVEEGQ